MPVALLRPPAVRKLVALLRPLPVRERTTILAQAIHEGTMTRVGADQVRVRARLDGNSFHSTRAALRPVSRTSAAQPAPSLTSR